MKKQTTITTINSKELTGYKFVKPIYSFPIMFEHDYKSKVKAYVDMTESKIENKTTEKITTKTVHENNEHKLPTLSKNSNKKHMYYEDDTLNHVDSFNAESKIRDYLKKQPLDNLLIELSAVYEDGYINTEYFSILLVETAKQFVYSKLRLAYQYMNNDSNTETLLENRQDKKYLANHAYYNFYDNTKYYASEFPRQLQRDVTEYTRTQNNYKKLFDEYYKETVVNKVTGYSTGVYSENGYNLQTEYLKAINVGGDGMEVLNECITVLLEYCKEMYDKNGYVDFLETVTEKKLSKTTFQYMTEKREFKDVETTYKKKVYQHLENYINDKKRFNGSQFVYVQDIDDPEIYYRVKYANMFASKDSNGLYTSNMEAIKEIKEVKETKETVVFTDNQKIVLGLFISEQCFSVNAIAFMYSVFKYRDDLFTILKKYNFNVDTFIRDCMTIDECMFLDIPKECQCSRQAIQKSLKSIEKKFIMNGLDFSKITEIRDENMHKNMTDKEFLRYLEKVENGIEV